MPREFRLRHDEADWAPLLDAIHELHLHPEDVYEVTALLESLGWTDARARQRYGAEDVFDLARRLYELERPAIDVRSGDYVVPASAWRRFAEATRQFLRGIVFALPMVLSIVSMLTLHFSLWSYQFLPVNLATAIAIGTILSFLTVGGFMQAIARRAFFYIFQQYYKMAQRVTFHHIAAGIVTSLGVSGLLVGVNALFPVLPPGMLWVTLAFYVVLNAIWLSVTVMYVLKSELMFTGLLVAGIMVVWVAFVRLHLNIIVAQLAAMTCISVVGLLVVAYLFRRSPNRLEHGIQPHLPRVGISVYSTLPYFVYGCLYFLLLFVDRVIAWSTNAPGVAYFIWFRGDYEVGLDFALVTLVLPLGLSEVLVSRWMNDALEAERHYASQQSEVMNRRFLRAYQRGIRWMAVVATGSALLVYFGVKWLLDHYLMRLPQSVSLTPNSNYVFAVGLAAYSILSLGLLNAVTMFSLSRPELVVRPLAIAVAANMGVGFLLSRWFGYADAVWGVFVGSVLFAILTSRNIRRVMRRFDYHLYLLS
ncbi:MAG: hypothetical protein K6T78_02215 [Alicyclobacillus sp.]|nr:hypothetical protein [Alicyclobacillus sp.]